tara:strand:+ start:3429 stop:4475 length:1047 start_codon:yes stop_codon:yes gene_type:complete
MEKYKKIKTFINDFFKNPNLNTIWDKKRESIVENIPKSPIGKEYENECHGYLCSVGLYAVLSDTIYHLQTSPEPKKTVESIVKCFGYQVYWKHIDQNDDLWTEVLVVYRYLENNKKHVIIVHRGTQFEGGRILHDLSSYKSVIFNSFSDKLGDTRLRLTENIIKKLKPDIIDITGHSLGGWTAIYAISNSELLRKYLRFSVLFNPGYVPSEINKVEKSSMKITNKELKKLDQKVLYYINTLDPVSKGIIKGIVPFGKLKVVNKSSLKEIRKQVSFERLTMFIGLRDVFEKILYAKDFSKMITKKLLSKYLEKQGYNPESHKLVYNFLVDAHSLSQYIPEYYMKKLKDC